MSYIRAAALAAITGQAMACSAPGGDTPDAKAADSPAAVAASAGGAAQSQAIDWKAVEAAMGRSGAEQPGGVYRFSLPRGDMEVTAAGVRIRPALALGSWVAFKAHGNGAMAMGDLVLAEDELNPVLSRLQQGGVEQTAALRHLLDRQNLRHMNHHAPMLPRQNLKFTESSPERSVPGM